MHKLIDPYSSTSIPKSLFQWLESKLFWNKDKNPNPKQNWCWFRQILYLHSGRTKRRHCKASLHHRLIYRAGCHPRKEISYRYCPKWMSDRWVPIQTEIKLCINNIIPLLLYVFSLEKIYSSTIFTSLPYFLETSNGVGSHEDYSDQGTKHNNSLNCICPNYSLQSTLKKTLIWLLLM